jgi:hypothetical protein
VPQAVANALALRFAVSAASYVAQDNVRLDKRISKTCQSAIAPRFTMLAYPSDGQ